MAAANSTGLRSRSDHRPSAPHFPSHVAARVAADWDNRRPVVPRIPAPRGPVDHQGDSDPDADEALRRVRDHRDAIREGLAAAREYAASVAA